MLFSARPIVMGKYARASRWSDFLCWSLSSNSHSRRLNEYCPVTSTSRDGFSRGSLIHRKWWRRSFIQAILHHFIFWQIAFNWTGCHSERILGIFQIEIFNIDDGQAYRQNTPRIANKAIILYVPKFAWFHFPCGLAFSEFARPSLFFKFPYGSECFQRTMSR